MFIIEATHHLLYVYEFVGVYISLVEVLSMFMERQEKSPGELPGLSMKFV
jgi:hypothetical protein